MSGIWLIRLSLSSQALALALAIAYNPSYPRPSKQRSGVLPHGFYQQVAPSLPCPVSRHRNSAGLSHLKVDAGAARPLVARLGVVLSLSLSLLTRLRMSGARRRPDNRLGPREQIV